MLCCRLPSPLRSPARPFQLASLWVLFVACGAAPAETADAGTVASASVLTLEHGQTPPPKSAKKGEAFAAPTVGVENLSGGAALEKSVVVAVPERPAVAKKSEAARPLASGSLAVPPRRHRGSAPASLGVPSALRGVPVCRHVGTRSEAWFWPDDERITYAKCDGKSVACKNVGTRSEGWFSGEDRVAFVKCAK
ncbi:MAG: hypothetical protein V3V08_00135 [Nannocystaceae bacterium]